MFALAALQPHAGFVVVIAHLVVSAFIRGFQCLHSEGVSNSMLHVCWLQIGQALSSRPDVLPPEYITELEVLQDRIPPFSNDEALQVCKCSRRAVSTALYLLNRQLQQMHWFRTQPCKVRADRRPLPGGCHSTKQPKQLQRARM